MDEITLVQLSQIDGDGTQTRSGIREKAVADYKLRIENGEPMDPAVVFKDGTALHIAAGYHRREAYRQLGRSEMPCIVKSGDKWTAVKYGLIDNQKHVGVRLDHADKDNSVKVVLRMQPEMSNVLIAKLCSVSDKTVAKRRADMEASSEIPRMESRVDARGVSRPAARPAQLVAEVITAEPIKEPHDAAHCGGCGGVWESDGNGGRFCIDCLAPHPDDPQSGSDLSSDLAPIPEPSAVASDTLSDDRISSSASQEPLGQPQSETGRDRRPADGETPGSEAAGQQVATPVLFREAYKRLGRFYAAVDELKHLGRVRHREFQPQIRTIGAMLKAWHIELGIEVENTPR